MIPDLPALVEHRVQRRMISVVIIFVFLRLLFFAVLLLYVNLDIKGCMSLKMGKLSDSHLIRENERKITG